MILTTLGGELEISSSAWYELEDLPREGACRRLENTGRIDTKRKKIPVGIESFEKIRREVENLRYEYEGKELTNTMTFGIASSLEADSLEQLVKLADERLYLGKQKGKNQVV